MTTEIEAAANVIEAQNAEATNATTSDVQINENRIIAHLESLTDIVESDLQAIEAWLKDKYASL